MFGSKINFHVFMTWVLATGRVAFLIWFTAWVIARFEMLEKIGAWFQ